MDDSAFNVVDEFGCLGLFGQCLQVGADASAKDVDVGARSGIAKHAEIELPLVRECSHRGALISQQRHEGKGFEQLGSEGIERDGRSWHIGDHQVEERLVLHDASRCHQEVLGQRLEQSQGGGRC